MLAQSKVKPSGKGSNLAAKKSSEFYGSAFTHLPSSGTQFKYS